MDGPLQKVLRWKDGVTPSQHIELPPWYQNTRSQEEKELSAENTTATTGSGQGHPDGFREQW